MYCPTHGRLILPGGTCPRCAAAQPAPLPVPAQQHAPQVPQPRPPAYNAPRNLPAGTTAHTTHTSATAIAGTVTSRPTISATMRSPAAGLKALAVFLCVILVLVSPELRGAMVFFVVMLGICAWLLSRIGVLGIMGLMLPRGRRMPKAPQGELAFRCDDAGQVTDVRLYGHDAGIHLGDRVQARGVRHNGVFHVAVLHNRTTGATLWRSGLLGFCLLAAFDAYMILAILANVRR